MCKHFSMTPTHNTAVYKTHEHLPALHELDTNTVKNLRETERLHLPRGEQTVGKRRKEEEEEKENIRNCRTTQRP